jgi:hypothetical protein
MSLIHELAFIRRTPSDFVSHRRTQRLDVMRCPAVSFEG